MWVISQYITVRYFVQVKEPPKSVGMAGKVEAAFGTLIWGTLWFIENNGYLLISIMLLGLFWIGVAVSLCRGSKAGRTICLILCILRIPTIIGAFFSAYTLYKLYFVQESKDFFNEAVKK